MAGPREPLTSPLNPKLKALRKLRRRRVREESGMAAVEGVTLVLEALRAGLEVEAVYVTPRLAERPLGPALLSELSHRGLKPVPVEDRVLARLCDTETPQGVVAVVRVGRSLPESGAALDRMLNTGPGSRGLVLVVEGVQDPGNLGTLIRAADAAGAGAVLLLPGTVDPWNPKAVRASMGSLFHLPVWECGPPAQVLPWLGQRGFLVVAGVPLGGTPVYRLDLTGPAAVVVGSEARGLSPESLALSHRTASVPVVGRAESLNVGLAAAVLLFEAVRQRLWVQGG
ncbi:MAG: RNA methyltransferase [Acetobacteraceae bacterium]|nr:RNA methyltransferase [Acetobacteraceae bacterium]